MVSKERAAIDIVAVEVVSGAIEDVAVRRRRELGDGGGRKERGKL